MATLDSGDQKLHSSDPAASAADLPNLPDGISGDRDSQIPAPAALPAPTPVPAPAPVHSPTPLFAPAAAIIVGASPCVAQDFETPPDQIGSIIDQRFKIVARLGAGGMSEVFKAEHLILQKPLAIKILHAEESAKTNSSERFQQEAKAISALDHPNIVRVYAFGCGPSGSLYLTMDYLNGKSLADILADKQSLPWNQVVKLGMQIAQGLEHAHSRGIIHRDLKPSNIILLDDTSGGEQVKIVDFGIARLTEKSGKEIRELTQAGKTCGSPPYMSPEQCLGEPVDGRSDVYSFGCMIYELLSGKRPFTASSNMELMQKHLRQSPKFFNKVSPELAIPPALEAIVRKCMEKNPAHRYLRMCDLYEDLRQVGSASAAEAKLKKAHEQETVANNREEVQKLLRASKLPFSIFLVCCVAVVVALQVYSPQIKKIQLQNEVSGIAVTDPDRLKKLFALLPALVEMEMQQGDRDRPLLRMRELETELKRMPLSRTQCHYLVRLARLYTKIGRQDEGRALNEQTLQNLEAFIMKCNAESNFAELEPASLEVLKICRNDASKIDHLLGQYNILIPMYIWRQKYNLAEKLSRTALQSIQSSPRTNDTNEIVMLVLLSESLRPQAKYLQVQHALEHAWELCLKGWTSDSPIAQNVGKKLLECYRAEGKKQEENLLLKSLHH